MSWGWGYLVVLERAVIDSTVVRVMISDVPDYDKLVQRVGLVVSWCTPSPAMYVGKRELTKVAVREEERLAKLFKDL